MLDRNASSDIDAELSQISEHARRSNFPAQAALDVVALCRHQGAPAKGAKALLALIDPRPDLRIYEYEVAIGRLSLWAGDGIVAARHLRRAAALGDGRKVPRSFFLDFGRSLLMVGDTAGAIEALKHADAMQKDSAETTLWLGRAFLKADKFEEANDLLKKGVALAPTNVGMWLELARSSEQLGDENEAMRALRQASEVDSTSTTALKRLADFQRRRKQWSALVETAAQWKSRDPSALMPLKLLATAQQKVGKSEDAAASWQEMLSYDSGSAPALEGLMKSARALGDSARAEEAARSLLEGASRTGKETITDALRCEALLLLASVERDRRRHQLALEFYQQAADLSVVPLYAAEWGIAASLRDLGKSAESESVCRRLVGNFPRTVGGWILLAGLLRGHGQYDEALSCVSKAVEISGSTFEIKMEQVRCLRGAQRLDEAQLICARLAEDSPQRPEPLVELGKLALGRNRSEEAAVRFLEALDITPDYVAAQRELARAYSELGRYQLARRLLVKLAKRSPFDSKCKYDLARLAQKHSNHADASLHWSELCKIEPVEPAVFRGLIQSLIALGRASEAQAAIDVAVVRWPQALEFTILQGELLEDSPSKLRSIQHWQRAAENFPDSVECLSRLAKAYSSEGLLNEADAEYARAINRFPGDSQLTALYERFRKSHQLDLAKDRFKALESKPDDPDVRKFVCDLLEAAIQDRVASFQGRARFFDRGIAFDALCELQDAFEMSGKNFFLISGTFLGVVRDGGFVENDYDIDLGVFEDKITLDELRLICSRCPNLSIVEDKFLEYRVMLTHKSSLEIEIFIHRREGDFIAIHTECHSWFYTPFEIRKYNFGDRYFYGPSDYDRYLTENYGDWRSKVAFYDFSFDTPNRTYPDSIDGLFYLVLRLRNAVAEGNRGGVEMLAPLLRDYFGIDYTSILPKNESPLLRPVSERLALHGSGTGEKRQDSREISLFTPGPVEMYAQDLANGSIQPPYFRNAQFSDLILECEQILLELANAPAGSRAVFLCASGTGAMEAAVLNLCRRELPTLALNGGGFGERFCEILRVHALPFAETSIDRQTGFSAASKGFPGGPFGATVCNAVETTTGAVNDVKLFGALAAAGDQKPLNIVDGISAFLCDPIDMAKTNIDVLILASQKALALPPGVSLLLLSPRAIEYCQHAVRTTPPSYYFDLRTYLRDGMRGQTPFTPAVGILVQLRERLRQLARAGGADAAVGTAADVARFFRRRLEKEALPFRIFALPASNAVTALQCTDERLSADALVKHLERAHKLFVTPSNNQLFDLRFKDKVFRVAHMGRQDHRAIERLILAMKEYVVSVQARRE